MSSGPMYWEYRPEWCAWWLMVPNDGTTAQRGYGPFNETEAQWAAEVHGVAFVASTPHPVAQPLHTMRQ